MIADGDSSTYRAKKEADPYQGRHIEKIECVNHLMKNFRNKLEEVTKQTSAALNFENAKSLCVEQSSNAAEQYNSVLAKMVGGKRVISHLEMDTEEVLCWLLCSLTLIRYSRLSIKMFLIQVQEKE